MRTNASAQELAPQCVAAHSQGQLSRDAGLFLEARELFVGCSVEGCPDQIRVECAKLLSELHLMTPTVVFAAREATGRDVLSAAVFVDGKRIEGALNGRAVALNPGPHAIGFVHPDGTTVQFRALAAEGMKRWPIVGVFPAPSELQGPDAAPRSQAGATAFPVLPIALASIGAVAAGGFAYFALSGRSQQRHLENTCAPDCAEFQRQDVERSYLFADIALVAAVLGLGSGAYLYVSELQAPSAAPSARGSYLIGAGGVF